PGGETRPSRTSHGDDAETVAPKHNLLQTRLDSARQEPSSLFWSAFGGHSYPSVATMRSKASPVVLGSCTSATLTWFAPGLSPLAPSRARYFPGSSLTPHPSKRVFFALPPPSWAIISSHRKKPPCGRR